MSATPLCSVILPSYNHAAYVRAAVESVLAQTFRDLELIVIDDGSSDGSAAILAGLVAQDPRMQLILRANKGAPATINEGIAHARGKWIAIINSDDLFAPNRIETLVERVEAAAAGWGFTQCEIIDSDGKRAIGSIADWYRDLQHECNKWPTVGYALLKLNVMITTGNLFCLRKLFDPTGGFRELRLVHDWDFALRLLYQAEPIYVDQPLYAYRLHDQNTIRKIAQSTTDREVSFILRDFLLALTLTTPPNALAPNPYTWPGYFEEIIERLDFQGEPYQTYMPSRLERRFKSRRALAGAARGEL
jgi:glycosyltransferase involved in cell wall biosynthesis